MNYPTTAANMRAMVGWTLAESALVGGAASNPINSTWRAPGATPFNTIRMKNGGVIHVWNYVDCEQGLKYTAKTLRQHDYDDITSELAKGTGNIGHAASLKVWGTHVIRDDVMAQADRVITAHQ
jgi:hypothetical protein